MSSLSSPILAYDDTSDCHSESMQHPKFSKKESKSSLPAYRDVRTFPMTLLCSGKAKKSMT